MSNTTLASDRAYQFSEDDFQRVAHTAKTIIGLHLEPSKKALIQARLAKRLRITKAATVVDYCALVQSSKSGERDQFISALTTNVTHFFRERHHFDYLERDILPPLLESAKAGRRVRIWSAGCSTGQEAYSIAATILQLVPNAETYDVKVLASDIDETALQVAKSGIYTVDECRFDDLKDTRKVFPPTSSSSTRRSIREDVKRLVTFERVNLFDSWPNVGSFDVIFCRNVAIYFDRRSQSQLWLRFVERLTQGGCLFIGHSERIHGPAERRLRAFGITAYRMHSQ